MRASCVSACTWDARDLIACATSASNYIMERMELEVLLPKIFLILRHVTPKFPAAQISTISLQIMEKRLKFLIYPPKIQKFAQIFYNPYPPRSHFPQFLTNQFFSTFSNQKSTRISTKYSLFALQKCQFLHIRGRILQAPQQACTLPAPHGMHTSQRRARQAWTWRGTTGAVWWRHSSPTCSLLQRKKLREKRQIYC